MECNCCKAKVDSGFATCSVCGFPVLVGGGNTKEEVELINDYRKRKIGAFSIYLKVYDYTIDNQGTDEKQESYVKLTDVDALEHGAIKWSEYDYQDVETNQTINIQIRISSNDSTVEKIVSLKSDEKICYNSVGIVINAGFSLQIVAGNKLKYIMSEPIKLI